MGVETTQAAILILKAKALEAYGVIKGIHERPAQQGDAEKIAAQALILAQYEGAMLTVQQYFNNIEQPPPDELPAVTPEPEPEEDPERRVLGPEDSETLRRTLAVHEATRASKERDES